MKKRGRQEENGRALPFVFGFKPGGYTWGVILALGRE